MKKEKMKVKGKKFVSLFIVFSLVALSGNMYAKKKGAELLIQKKDGPEIEGELITVKKSSLLLLSESGADVSVDIGDIKVINIRKKSRVGKGILYGFLSAGGVGVILGFLGGDDPPGFFSMTASEKAVMGGAFLGLIGAAVGGIGSAFSEPYKTIRIDVMSDSRVQEVLEKLRSKARIPDYQ